jgi:alkanesulfonate monooxygenase SsuD/methylene tetrahydromethanopterin reductase-like flavin-dependent oxidoreductase (luciferase family)
VSWNNESEAEMVDGERRILTGTPQQLADDIKGLEELGVNHLLLNLQAENLDATLARMEGFATKVRPLT